MSLPPTAEQTWLESLRLAPDWTPDEKATVVVSPHPDDETLAAGGLIATQRLRKVPVTLLAITDGEAAYLDEPDLGRTRRVEQAHAADALGVRNPEAIIRFGLRDSAVTECESVLAETIASYVDRDTLLVAPWPLDPHPDHEACGRAAAKVARQTGATLISYFFWTWHRFRPEHLDSLPLRRLTLTGEAQTCRAKALACHRSQLQRDEGPPILPEIFLAPARRPFETFLIYGDQYSL